MSDSLNIKLQKLYKEMNDILPSEIKFEDFTLQVDRSSATVYRSEDLILFSQNKIFNEIKHKYSPKLIIDIGANVGFSTLVFAKVFKKTDIIAIEPNHNLIEIINTNCKNNKINNVKILQKAVGESSDVQVDFQINKIMSVDSRVVGLEDSYELCRVDQTSIDRIIIDYGLQKNESFFMKIDTQGFEERVISGARETIHDFQKYCIMIEFAPYWLEKSGTDPAKFLEKLCKNYNVCEMPSSTMFFHQTLDEIQRNKITGKSCSCIFKICHSTSKKRKGMV